MNVRSAVPHLAALGVIVACVWLAQWQIERAGEKREIVDRWHDRAPIALSALETPFSLPQPVTGVGNWDPDRQILVDNRIRDQRTGVHVLTPLTTPDGRIFLVNRGWAHWPSRSARLPDPGVARRATEIRGVLNTPPGTGVQLGEPAFPLDRDWPILATYFDHERLAELFGDALQPAVIQLDPSHPDHLTGDAWKIVTFGPERHIGYAMTWSTIAIVVAIIWLALTVRRLRRRNEPLTENERQ